MTSMTRKKDVQYNLADAKARLSSVVREVLSGTEVVIAKDNKPLVKLVRLTTPKGKRRPGSGKGQLLYLADDFDAPLDDFKDHM